MKKSLSFFIALLCLGITGFSQVPMYFNSNTIGGANSIPFASGGTLTWRRAQFCITPGTLGGVGPGNNITKIYFQSTNAVNVTYPNFWVRLKTATAAGMTGITAGPFEAGMTQVFYQANFNMITTAGGWVQITLQTPFLYDPTLPLIVDFEHDHTSAAGPTVSQPVVIVGPGNGRQWGGIAGAPIAGTGTQRLNFGIDVLPATPCSSTPGPNSVITPSNGICPNSATQIGLATTYSFGGITYVWQYSNLSSVGPWTTVPNATTAVITTPSLATTHYFQTLITCTNTNGSVTASPGTLMVQPTTTMTVPYYEGFEGIGSPNKMPNCSWQASSIGNTCLTYTSVQNMTRYPRNGSSFASFYYTPAANNYFFTNGVWLEPGVTYSTGLWYVTDYYTYPTWQLNMWVGPNQSTVNAAMVATSGGAGSASSPSYKSLSGTFTVATAGLYYVGINAISNGVCCGYYLSFDDFSLEAPCILNPLTVAVTANNSTVCAGQSVNLTATGADTYLWSNGATISVINVAPFFSGQYSVTGTKTLTGCNASAVQFIQVNPSPFVSAVATKYTICNGQSTTLQAFGADTYMWSNNASGNIISVSPTSNTSYTVIGTNSYGCTGNGVVAIQVNPLPVVGVSSNNAGDLACREDVTQLTGTGAVSYMWNSPTGVLMGSPVNISPDFTTTYTVVGTDANGCQGNNTYQLSVMDCVGLRDVSSTASGIKIYPNPSKGEFIIEVNNKNSNAVVVTDLTGRIVMSLNSRNEKINLDMTTYSNGVYYVKISSDHGSEVIKIVKQ